MTRNAYTHMEQISRSVFLNDFNVRLTRCRNSFPGFLNLGFGAARRILDSELVRVIVWNFGPLFVSCRSQLRCRPRPADKAELLFDLYEFETHGNTRRARLQMSTPRNPAAMRRRIVVLISLCQLSEVDCKHSLS